MTIRKRTTATAGNRGSCEMTMQTHYCLQCETSKPVEDFYKDKNKSTGLYSHCKKCHGAMTSRWKKQNKTRNNDINTQWRKKNKSKVAASKRKYEQRHPDYVARKYKTIRDWKRRNPMRVQRWNNRRRSRKAFGVPQRWVKSDCPDNLCYWCGNEISEQTRHVDHIMPISLGGQAVDSNEVWTCKPCNLRKHKRHPLTWLAMQFDNQYDSHSPHVKAPQETNGNGWQPWKL